MNPNMARTMAALVTSIALAGSALAAAPAATLDPAIAQMRLAETDVRDVEKSHEKKPPRAVMKPQRDARKEIKKDTKKFPQ